MDIQSDKNNITKVLNEKLTASFSMKKPKYGLVMSNLPVPLIPITYNVFHFHLSLSLYCHRFSGETGHLPIGGDSIIASEIDRIAEENSGNIS